MKALHSRPALAAAALVALGALAYLCFARPTAGALRPAPGAEDADGARQRQAALDDYREDLVQRVEARQRLVREVIDGRLSLPEAAARFQEIDRASKTFNWDRFRGCEPGATDEEKQCRAVLVHVESQLINDPDRARAVRRRLEAELQAYLAKRGAAGENGPAPADAGRGLTARNSLP